MKGGAAAKKPGAGGAQASISSFFKPKPAVPAGTNVRGSAATPSSANVVPRQPAANCEMPTRVGDDVMEIAEEPQPQAAAIAAGKRARAESDTKFATGTVHAESGACSDEEAPTRKTRRRARVSLKESSSEEEEEEEGARGATTRVVVDSDGGSEAAGGASSEPTPMRAAIKTKREPRPAISKPKMPSEPSDPKGKDAEETIDEKRHEMFVKKVGLFQKNEMMRAADTGSTEGREEIGSGKLQTCALTFPRSAKLTPFETQVVEIKNKHPDKVLLVECGYKYKFLGRDAEIAAKVLNIFHHIDHNFLTASIPTFRLQVHTRRLVEAGYKVGVVRQMETAALKAAGDNRNKQFKRELCEVYTKSTMLVEDVDVLGEHAHVNGGSSANSVYMMCICEHVVEGEQVRIGMVCIDTASGDIVYDEWEDSELRQNLASRVVHLAPRELLLPEGLSKTTERLLKRLVAPLAMSQASEVRVEMMKKHHFVRESAEKRIGKFFQDASKRSGDDDACIDGDNACEIGCVSEGTIGSLGGESVMSLPTPVVCCLGGLLHYLSEFKLDRVLGLTSNFWRFSSPSHMMMDATTLMNLEVLQNQNDKTEHGSLLWLLKQTKTAFGARLLRHWITHPLLDKQRITARHDAVEELMEGPQATEAMAKHLKGIPDLERALTRLHYSKCSPNELVAVLRAFIKVGEIAKDAKKDVDTLRSSLLIWLVKGMPEPSSKLEGFLNAMDLKAACAVSSNGKAEPDTRNLLRGYKDRSQYPTIYDIKKDVADVEERLQEHLVHCRSLLGMRDLEYKTVLTSSHLLEVPNDKAGRVPKNWVKINGTKAAGRYHSPEVQELQQDLMRCHERLDAQTNTAWQEFQAQVAECYGTLHAVVQRLAVLDCLLSLSEVAKNGGWCRPTLYDDHQLRVVGGKHPTVDALMGGGYVPNDMDLSHGGQVAMVITGPNMGGKSSFMRANALLVIMAQVGSFVPADEMHMGVFDNVFTRMGAEDFIAQGRSTFMVELQEAADILVRATSRSLIIMDELGRGTSTHDGTAIAYATLRTLVQDIRAFTLFVTHYQLICQLQTEMPSQVGNYHMGYMEESENRIVFLYKLVTGSAKRSFGLNVALLAKLPEDIVQRAASMSQRLEAHVQEKLGECLAVLAAKVMHQVGTATESAGIDTAADEAANGLAGRLMAFAKEARQLLSARTLI